MTKQTTIGVIGAGAWGTALANHFARQGHRVTLWAREPEVVEQIRSKRINQTFLPGVTLSKTLQGTDRLGEAVREKRILLVVVPTQFVRGVLKELTPHLPEGAVIGCASKGVETGTQDLLSKVFEEVLPHSFHWGLFFLSGPTFAREVGEQHPAALTVASHEESVGRMICELLETDLFHANWTPDVIGVEIAGAMKNVIAIGCGISDGLEFGDSTRAMLITQGLHEMVTLGRKIGANPETFRGLAGIGDLVLTCAGNLSRNRALGMRLARGETLEMVRASTQTIAEGVETSKAIHNLARLKKARIPICERVYHILHEGLPVKEILRLEGFSSPSVAS